jgi:hypothetical protein
MGSQLGFVNGACWDKHTYSKNIIIETLILRPFLVRSSELTA